MQLMEERNKGVLTIILIRGVIWREFWAGQFQLFTHQAAPLALPLSRRDRWRAADDGRPVKPLVGTRTAVRLLPQRCFQPFWIVRHDSVGFPSVKVHSPHCVHEDRSRPCKITFHYRIFYQVVQFYRCREMADRPANRKVHVQSAADAETDDFEKLFIERGNPVADDQECDLVIRAQPDQHSASVRTPVLVQDRHEAPAAIPICADLGPAFVNAAPPVRDDLWAENVGRLRDLGAMHRQKLTACGT
jgi:hypothetical protein